MKNLFIILTLIFSGVLITPIRAIEAISEETVTTDTIKDSVDFIKYGNIKTIVVKYDVGTGFEPRQEYILTADKDGITMEVTNENVIFHREFHKYNGCSFDDIIEKARVSNLKVDALHGEYFEPYGVERLYFYSNEGRNMTLVNLYGVRNYTGDFNAVYDMIFEQIPNHKEIIFIDYSKDGNLVNNENSK